MPWITSADHGDTMLVHDITVDLRDGCDDRGNDVSEADSCKRKKNNDVFFFWISQTRTERIHTRIPTLMAAYTYAKLRAMGSLEALNSATASVPIKIDMLRYETHAETAR